MLSLILLATSAPAEDSEIPNSLIKDNLDKAKKEAGDELAMDLTCVYVDAHNALVEQAHQNRATILRLQQQVKEHEKWLAKLDKLLAYASEPTENTGAFITHIAPMVYTHGDSAKAREFIQGLQGANISTNLPMDYETPSGFKGAARRVKLAVPKARV